jgi:hypothetical protein
MGKAMEKLLRNLRISTKVNENWRAQLTIAVYSFSVEKMDDWKDIIQTVEY